MFNFLKLKQETFSLDISDLSLKIVKLEKKKGFFSLASYNKISIKPGIVEEGVIQDEESLSEIIKKACKTVTGKKLNTKYVVLSLPEEKTFLQIIKMPKMKEKELKSAVFFEAENYIPLPISEVYLDFQIIPPAKDNLNHMDVLIVATPKKIVNGYVSCLEKAGLTPFIIEVESQAIVRALVKNEFSSSPIVILDLGQSNTNFIVFSGKSIRLMYSLPVSSQQLTVAIAESLKVDFNKAEKMKLQYDLQNMKKDDESIKVFKAINTVLDDLITQIKKYLTFYQSHSFHEHINSESKVESILLCGGGANLKGLPEFLSKKLDIPTKLGNPWINFPVKKPNNYIHNDSLYLTTALGLELREINNTKDNNL